MPDADSDKVTIERHGEVALVTLNRPDQRNAVDVALAGQLVDAMAACADARAIVLTGADPAFCAGLDLRSIGVDDFAELPNFIGSVADSPVPVIAAVNGPAVTGGFEIALAADFIVASERAAFADTHLRVRVYPGPVLVDLPRRVGPAWAREMSLTGNFVDAETALRIGIANHVVPHDELVPLALDLAQAMAELDPAMVQAVRHDWDESVGGPIAEARATHWRHTREFMQSARTTTSVLNEHRDAVLERSRNQRDAT